MTKRIKKFDLILFILLLYMILFIQNNSFPMNSNSNFGFDEIELNINGSEIGIINENMANNNIFIDYLHFRFVYVSSIFNIMIPFEIFQLNDCTILIYRESSNIQLNSIFEQYITQNISTRALFLSLENNTGEDTNEMTEVTNYLRLNNTIDLIRRTLLNFDNFNTEPFININDTCDYTPNHTETVNTTNDNAFCTTISSINMQLSYCNDAIDNGNSCNLNSFELDNDIFNESQSSGDTLSSNVISSIANTVIHIDDVNILTTVIHAIDSNSNLQSINIVRNSSLDLRRLNNDIGFNLENCYNEYNNLFKNIISIVKDSNKPGIFKLKINNILQKYMSDNIDNSNYEDNYHDKFDFRKDRDDHDNNNKGISLTIM